MVHVQSTQGMKCSCAEMGLDGLAHAQLQLPRCDALARVAILVESRRARVAATMARLPVRMDGQ
jgi:hypothetical protein